ncbi:MAG: hypothetical protein ACI8SE_000594 [Bacteroidia bacterium]|jgi:hypothetical protein
MDQGIQENEETIYAFETNGFVENPQVSIAIATVCGMGLMFNNGWSTNSYINGRIVWWDLTCLRLSGWQSLLSLKDFWFRNAYSKVYSLLVTQKKGDSVYTLGRN